MSVCCHVVSALWDFLIKWSCWWTSGNLKIWRTTLKTCFSAPHLLSMFLYLWGHVTQNQIYLFVPHQDAVHQRGGGGGAGGSGATRTPAWTHWGTLGSGPLHWGIVGNVSGRAENTGAAPACRTTTCSATWTKVCGQTGETGTNRCVRGETGLSRLWSETATCCTLLLFLSPFSSSVSPLFFCALSSSGRNLIGQSDRK